MDSNCDRTHLPGEITDAIIDHLHNDSSALSSCGLVCSRWISVVRFHRFQRIELNNHLSFLAFRDLLRSNRDLGSYTTSLIWRVHDRGRGTLMRAAGFTGLREILPCLPRLQSLHIYDLIIGKESAPELLRSLPKSVEELEMTRTTVPSIDGLILLWTSLPHLRYFTANDYLTFDQPDSSQDQQLVTATTIDGAAHVSFSTFHFIVRCHPIELAGILADQLCTYGMLSQVRMCSLLLDVPQDVHLVGKISHALGPSLEVLELWCSGEGRVSLSGSAPASVMGDLAQCSSLRELRFSGPEQVSIWSPRWITGVLSVIRPKGVQIVVITIACDYTGRFSKLQELHDVAAALSHDVFKSLERVSIWVYGNSRGSLPKVVLPTIRECFAQYDSRGLLEIDEGPKG